MTWCSLSRLVVRELPPKISPGVVLSVANKVLVGYPAEVINMVAKTVWDALSGKFQKEECT